MTTTFDFEDGNGPVPAHRHTNPDGVIGGWVADTAYVGPLAYVGPDANVTGEVVADGRVPVGPWDRVYLGHVIEHRSEPQL